MNEKQRTKISKRLSLVLRHKPESIGLTLDSEGWAEVDELIANLERHGLRVDRMILEEVLRTNDKQRFKFSEDGQRICANQGHSIDVEFQLEPVPPPEVLYHGTASRFTDSIFKEGLTKQHRHHVHLTEDIKMTLKVAERRGRPVLLGIRAKDMEQAGYLFYKTDNDVWLTDHVPPEYLYRGEQLS